MPSARIAAEALNISILRVLASNSQGHGQGRGERSPAGLARGSVEVGELHEVKRDPLSVSGAVVSVERITEPGKHTARRAHVIARLPRLHPHRLAAERYIAAIEAVGSVGCASILAGGGGSGRISDGGASSRVDQAADVRLISALLEARGDAITPSARGGSHPRRAITCKALIDAVCLRGLDMASLLKSAGWSAQSRDVKRLSAAASECLEDMARAFGFVSYHTKTETSPGKPVTSPTPLSVRGDAFRS